MASNVPTLRYRCPTAHGEPAPGEVMMGTGPRIRRAYRVLGAKRVRNCMPMMGFRTWRLAVEPMSVAAGRAEIDAGHRWWVLKWDRLG